MTRDPIRRKLRVWVTFGGGTKFGEGRAELLRLVQEEGSLRRAVARMGMSYRAAWGYLRELESAAGFAFVERSGAGPSGGMRLTERGRAFLAAFDRYRTRLDEAAEREFAASFGDMALGAAEPCGSAPRRTSKRRPPAHPGPSAD